MFAPTSRALWGCCGALQRCSQRTPLWAVHPCRLQDARQGQGQGGLPAALPTSRMNRPTVAAATAFTPTAPPKIQRDTVRAKAPAGRGSGGEGGVRGRPVVGAGGTAPHSGWQAGSMVGREEAARIRWGWQAHQLPASGWKHALPSLFARGRRQRQPTSGDLLVARQRAQLGQLLLGSLGRIGRVLDLRGGGGGGAPVGLLRAGGDRARQRSIGNAAQRRRHAAPVMGWGARPPNRLMPGVLCEAC
jgi:hypothetical protein